MKKYMPIILIVVLVLLIAIAFIFMNKNEMNNEEVINTDEVTNTDEVVISDEVNDGKSENSGRDILYYQGHASLRITTNEGKVIYIDPYMGDSYDVPADLVLVTHGHPDHNQVDKVENRNDDFQLVTYEDAIIDGEHQTFDLGYVKVIAVEAGYNQNHDRERCVGYVLEFTDGIKIYVAGDTSITPQMEELGTWNLDYAFIPCDGHFTMSLEEAADAARLVNAKHTIPYHMYSGKDFDEETANNFDVENKLIVRPNTEIEL